MRKSNPINVSMIDHVVIRVRDPASMLDFYCDVLGCRLERGPGEFGLYQLRAGTSLIDLVDIAGPLGRQGGGPPDGQAPNMDHFCLRISPWHEPTIVAHLESHGVYVEEVARRYGASGMGPSIYLKDPEGNSVELKGD